MNKYLIATTLGIVLSGCIRFQVEVNSNAYQSLSEAELKNVKSFEEAGKYTADSVNVVLYEINSADIKTLAKSQEYTWISLWQPWCSNEHCVNIKPFEELEKRHANQGLKLTFISYSYHFRNINKIVSNSDFQKDIFVLENDHYGRKLKDIRAKFREDFIPNAPDEIGTPDNYIFHGDSLVYYGSSINDSIVNSIIQ